MKYLARVRTGALVVLLALGPAACMPVQEVTAISPSADSTTTSPWTVRFHDDFAGTAPSADWAVMYGNTSPHYWTKSRVSVHDGMLTLQTAYNPATGHWESGSVVLKGMGQTYGRWAMRVRCSSGYTKCVSMLWPDAPVWPPEIDFYEIFAKDDARATSKQTLHYRSLAGAHRMHATVQRADFTQWHTVAVEWSPGKVDYFLDGRLTSTMTQDLPTIPLHLGMATSVVPTVTPTGPVAMDIDWVEQSTYTG